VSLFSVTGLLPRTHTPYLRSALTAILTSEKADLALVAKVWQALDAQVSDIQPGALRDAP